jgi:hypothetical protein
MACACAGTCTCGCCAGISQETPQTPDNRPGLTTIPYRVGTYQQFNDTLQARISLSGQPQLRALTTRESDDFTTALLDAFSVMADVLTFYTERYANESYLRTAVQRQSVVNLAALVGYEPSPGVAANTALAFTIDPSTGAFGPALTGAGNGQVVPAASSSVTIPAGTRVQSVPNNPTQTPQPFETSEDIEAQPAWNAIPPQTSVPQNLRNLASQTSCIFIASAATNLKPGDTLLICPPTGTGNPAQNCDSLLRTVSKVTVLADGKTTQVYLNSPISAGKGTTCQQPPGLVSNITSTTLNAAAVQQVLQYDWDNSTLVLLTQMNQWPIEQLEAAINQQVATTNQSPSGQLFAFRQQAAGFGFNLPIVMFPELSPAVSYDPVGDASLVSGCNLYLDAIYSQILPESWIVLRQDPGGNCTILRVGSVTTTTHSGFGSTAKVSLLTVLNPSCSYTVRATSVLCQSEELPLAMLTLTGCIEDGAVTPITLNQAYLGLTVGQNIVLSGQRMDLPGVLASELCTLKRVQLNCGITVITLEQRLNNKYVRSSVQINANVANATNGATVTEILGNGDGTQTFQSFTLKQSPLTYTTAATLSGGQSSLQVWVNNELWKEVPWFFGHGATEHIFTTTQNNGGTTTVTFPDGLTGSRLPTGTANVTATYRVGIGTPGLVDANQISMLTTRPLGVRAATNPLPSYGAQDPETIDDARSNATLTIMTLDRIVSLEDYQDFATAFLGVSKALAVWIWTGEQRIVLLTVAGVNGAVIQPIDDTGTALQNSVAAASEPFVTLQLQAYSPIYFRLAAKVTVSADFILDDVQTDVETALQSTFSFEARDFGQPVTLSEVIATIQNVDGVEGVLVTALYFSTDATLTPLPLNQYLPANIPQSGARSASLAQLLTLDSAPLSLDMETASS